MLFKDRGTKVQVMIARTTHSRKLMVLVALLAAGFVLVLSRPAAQTNGMLIESILRNARIVADLAADPAFVLGEESVDGNALIQFYQQRGSRLAWSGSSGTAASAAIAMQALSNANEHALDTTRYHLKQLAEIDASTSSDSAATYDLLLTDAILKYARDLRNGTPGAVDQDVDLPAEAFDAASALNAALEDGTLGEFLAELAPPHREYKRLAAALALYRKSADEGGWSHVRIGLGSERNEVDSRLLRERLAREDPTVDQDSDVTEALRRYQSRNGLEPDGVLGSQTLASLNIPTSERVEQIEANMERWRWLPHRLESRRVMVNAADATLEVFENDQAILRSRVIVGAPDKPTPIFRAVVIGVTVNPLWNVPASIARNEFLPRLRRNPNFLVSQNIVLLNGPPDDPHGKRIDWSAVSADAFPYRLQQRPGPGNALGQLKLEMPNAFSVYLHDTPGKREFDRPQRNLSHGCVRVEQILPLASVALGGDATEAAQILAGVAITGQTKYLKLEQPLPVYVLYWTAIGNADGTVQFRRDVYRRDERLARALRTGSIASSAFFTGKCERSTG
jgi:L,D-transpeptidase YcbB